MSKPAERAAQPSKEIRLAPNQPRDIARGTSIFYWEVSAFEESIFPGIPATGAGVDYRFISGIPGTVGDLPCRQAFRETMVGRCSARRWSTSTQTKSPCR